MKPDDLFNQDPRNHPKESDPPVGTDRMIALAERVTSVTGDACVGGIAVLLHGGYVPTLDIDIYSTDFKSSSEKLVAAGMPWVAHRREHLVDGVAIHMVKDDSLGGPPNHISTIRGVRVISLADLIRAKLTVGLVEISRVKDVAHVIELIQRIPLSKDFAPKLPTHLRDPFKVLVDQARPHSGGGGPNPMSTLKFYAEFGLRAS